MIIISTKCSCNQGIIITVHATKGSLSLYNVHVMKRSLSVCSVHAPVIKGSLSMCSVCISNMIRRGLRRITRVTFVGHVGILLDAVLCYAKYRTNVNQKVT